VELGYPEICRKNIRPSVGSTEFSKMNKNPLNQNVLTTNSSGLGPLTRAMVHARARELAQVAGRSPLQVSQVDYEHAKQELTGESDMDRQDAMLDSIPESKRWDPVPGSTGHQRLDSPSEDEDDEGRSASAQLVEEGAGEAGHDQMLQAAIEAAKENREGPGAMVKTKMHHPVGGIVRGSEPARNSACAGPPPLPATAGLSISVGCPP
jgi:hypothetical protein